MYATKKVVAMVRKFLPELLTLREEVPVMKNLIDFLIDGTFYDMDDDYFKAAFGDEDAQKKAQWFQHRKFSRIPNGHYYSATLKKFIHVAIWEFYNGAIPKGYVVHHKDFNPANNNLDNLQIMTRFEHMKIHNAARQPQEYICTYCGKKFYKYNNRQDTANNFCSEKCDRKWRKLHKLYFEERICVICGEKFSVPKNSKTKTCSMPCSRKLAVQTTKTNALHSCRRHRNYSKRIDA